MKSLYIHPLLREILFILFFAFITYLSLMPGGSVQKNFSPGVQAFHHDAHAILYFGLTSLALAAYAERGCSRWNIALLIIIYGGILEIVQTFSFVNRSCETGDFRSNAIGALIAAALYPLFVRLFRKIGIRITALAVCVFLAGGAIDREQFKYDAGAKRIIGLKMETQLNEGYCAPAVLSSLLNYYGIPVTQELLGAEAGSTEKGGTDVARLLNAVSTNHLAGTQWEIAPVFEATYSRGEYKINRYNEFAKEAGVAEIVIPKSGRLVYDRAFAGADLELLRKSVHTNDLRTFRTAVMQNIRDDNPLVWGVILGVAPEPSVTYKSPPAGHLRLITGYHPVTGEIYYDDTWGGPRGVSKRMKYADALAITMTLHVLNEVEGERTASLISK